MIPGISIYTFIVQSPQSILAPPLLNLTPIPRNNAWAIHALPHSNFSTLQFSKNIGACLPMVSVWGPHVCLTGLNIFD